MKFMQETMKSLPLLTEQMRAATREIHSISNKHINSSCTRLCQVFKRAEKDYIRSLKSVMTCTWGCSLVACWSKTVRRRFTLPEEQGTQLFCVQRQESQDNKNN
ncbi:unnamed protein product [Peronospora belbahrii]|uniref:Uncharacterized protein n=1 Tax=Peronospora belbahrii TaxID=622444 RepID=A0ABN8D171_9STRA|nr:unnamed protein product [Peronospora belbahrii]